MKRFLFLWTLGLALLTAQDAELPTIDATEIEKLREQEGSEIIVRGFIETTGKSASGVNFLNFRGTEFVCVVFAQNAATFTDGLPAEIYREKWVEVRGTLSSFRGKPQIKLEGPSQVTIIEAPAMVEAEPEPAKIETPAEPEEKIEEPEKKPEPEITIDGDTELIDGLPPVNWKLYFPG